VINPLGFSLENFDATGRWRTKDNKKKIGSRRRVPSKRSGAKVRP